MFAGSENDRNWDGPGRRRGKPGQTEVHRGQSPKAGLPRWRPDSSLWSPGEAPVCDGIAQCRPGCPSFVQDHPGLSRSSPFAITV